MDLLTNLTRSQAADNKLRDQVLGQNFSEHSGSVQLVSMSRFSPADHHDCIIAAEIVTTSSHNLGPSRTVQLGDTPPQRYHLLFSSASATFCMSPNHQKYLSTLALVVIVSVFCVISTSIVDIVPNQATEKYPYHKDESVIIENKLKSIHLEEILQNELSANYFNGSWVSDQEIVFYDIESNLCLYNVETHRNTHHVRFVHVLTKRLKELKLSNDRRYLLWPTETAELFRYSKLEKIKIYDIQNDTILNLFADSKFSDLYFHFGKWGPNSSQMVFGYNNNLYYKHSAQSEAIQLTVSGLNGVIFNGISDWLYEEEILNSDTAVWFSPSGNHLAYLQINDTLVEGVSWNRYGDYYNISNNQYPMTQSIRYAKPGTHNPHVSVYVANLHGSAENIQIVQISKPTQIENEDLYVTQVLWYDEDRLLVAWTVRNQTQSVLVLCDRLSKWTCEEVYKLRSRKGWANGFEDSLLSASNIGSVVVRLPKLVSRHRGEFYHIASIDIQSKKVKYLTDGSYDIIKLLKYSASTNEIFYASTLSNHPEVQHIMKIWLGEDNPEPVCLTCYLDNSCRYNDAHFSPNAINYVLECKGYEIPRVEVRSGQNNQLLHTWEENRKLYQFLKNKHIPRYEKIFVKLADNYDAIVELILPHNFNEDKRYPLVIELYGAPGTQSVKDKYEMNHWSSYLTTELEYVYARVDVRGTANQGIRHMHQLYKNVGHIEVNDLIDVVWFMKNNLTYINHSKIAIWGWSYGGYFSLMSLIREFDHRLFSCAIAVAPVSNWMYYDSAYSERYLGIPDHSNLYPYQDSNLLDSAALLKNKKFMIVFGTSDDNVHIQHSLMLIRKLNELNIDYEVQIYPDDNHYLLKSAPHLYKRMTNFIHNCFT